MKEVKFAFAPYGKKEIEKDVFQPLPEMDDMMFLEHFLPKYYSRGDVALLNDLHKYIDGEITFQELSEGLGMSIAGGWPESTCKKLHEVLKKEAAEAFYKMCKNGEIKLRI